MRSYRTRSPLPLPPLSSVGGYRRMGSLCLMLLVLAMIYRTASDPDTWRWMVRENVAQADADPIPPPDANPAQAGPPAQIPGGPTDESPGERGEAQRLFQAVTDRTILTEPEMPAYWKLMRWSLAQTQSAMEARADANPFFTRFFEEPEKQRGRLFRLRVHIGRIVDHEAPKNSAGVKRIYELWGWTDDSKSFPYLLVTSELPTGLEVGPNVHAEVVFTGYFLKTMNYQASTRTLSAPLLIGRVRDFTEANRARAKTEGSPFQLVAIVGVAGIGLVVAATLLWLKLTGAQPNRPLLSEAEDPVEEWLQADAQAAVPDSSNSDDSEEPSHKLPPDA